MPVFINPDDTVELFNGEILYSEKMGTIIRNETVLPTTPELRWFLGSGSVEKKERVETSLQFLFLLLRHKVRGSTEDGRRSLFRRKKKSFNRPVFFLQLNLSGRCLEHGDETLRRPVTEGDRSPLCRVRTFLGYRSDFRNECGS